MSLRIGRTLPPATAPVRFKALACGLLAMRRGSGATAALTETLKNYFAVSHCCLLSSGKASLALILQALQELYPDRDEVLIPAFTCYSVPAAIFRVGLKIRICDIEPETLDFDYPELTQQLSSPRLLCVIPTHLFGMTADIPTVRRIIGDRGIPIVEDAAQTMGGERWGRKAGTMGDVGFFSLERGKAFSTVKGGIIVTDNDAIGHALQQRLKTVPASSRAEQLRQASYALALAVFSRPWLYWIPRSLPFLGLGETLFEPDFPISRLSDFQAGMAAGWQHRLEEHMQLRAANAAYYGRLGISASCDPRALASGPVRYPFLVADHGGKEALLRHSDRLGLGAADVYPGTVDTIAALQGCLVGGTSARARTLVARMVTLPVHPYATAGDLRKIAGLLRPTEFGGTGGTAELAPLIRHQGGRGP